MLEQFDRLPVHALLSHINIIKVAGKSKKNPHYKVRIGEGSYGIRCFIQSFRLSGDWDMVIGLNALPGDDDTQRASAGTGQADFSAALHQNHTVLDAVKLAPKVVEAALRMGTAGRSHA